MMATACLWCCAVRNEVLWLPSDHFNCCPHKSAFPSAKTCSTYGRWSGQGGCCGERPHVHASLCAAQQQPLRLGKPSFHPHDRLEQSVVSQQVAAGKILQRSSASGIVYDEACQRLSGAFLELHKGWVLHQCLNPSNSTDQHFVYMLEIPLWLRRLCLLWRVKCGAVIKSRSTKWVALQRLGAAWLLSLHDVEPADQKLG